MASKALQRIEAYVQSNPCIDYAGKFEADELQEYRRMKREKEEKEGLPTRPSASSTAGASSAIPRFYFPKQLKADTPPAEAEAILLRQAVRSASKAREVGLRMRQLELCEKDVMDKLWELLAAAVSSPTAKFTYQSYKTFADEFERWRRMYFELEKPDFPYDEVLTSTRTPPAFHVTLLPHLDAPLFLAQVQTTSSAKQLYTTFIEQIALFKSETELVMRDDDCDGCLTEEELRSYVEELVPSVTVLEELDQDLIPFYCCSAVRRLFWVLDTKGTGKIRIEQLVTHSVMTAWLDVQLTSVDPERNWFSRNIATAIHEKFVFFNQSGTGMLSIEEMRKYKKGIPTVMDDGLPADVSPLTEFFMERVFEVMPLFKGEMDYQGFVDFVMAVELLPQCPRPSFFWEIFDIHHEGVLTPMTVNLFFRSVHNKLVEAGVNPPALDLIVPELFEVIASKEPLRLTKKEFFESDQAGLFSSLLIDCLSFWQYENREQQMVMKHQQQQES